MKLKLRNQVLDLGEPVVMGILNVTPDSFSDGGHFDQPGVAVAHAQAMHAAGARIIDIGGESTRPGAQSVPTAVEIERVIPVVECLAAIPDVLISVDTSKTEVMRAAIAAGAHMINDVAALRAAGALEVCADAEVAVCLMHMQGTPRNMQDAPEYRDVVAEVAGFLEQRVTDCMAAGIGRERIVIDPGFGFGKTLEHNLELLRELAFLCEMGLPVLAGLSRKSMLGMLLERPVGERLAGSVALATLAVSRGASIIRTHDVAETVDAVRVADAVERWRLHC